jgi:putative DNA primase/helicase
MADDSLLDRHRQDLIDQAIAPDIIDASGVRSIERPDQLPEAVPTYWANYLPARLYPWRMNGHIEWQLAPDDRTKHKYLFRDGAEVPLNQIRDTGQGPILLVEGTKQHLAAASYAPDEYAIYGMDGCWGWAHTNLSFCNKRVVTVVFDGDREKNRQVWDASKELKEKLELVGADQVLFAHPPGPGSIGLDDLLAQVDESLRTEVLTRLLERATPDLGKVPPRKKSSGSPWFGEGGLKARELAHAVWKAHGGAALTQEQTVALYIDGAYRVDPAAFTGAVVDILGDDYRRPHRSTVEDVLVGTLAMKRIYLPDRLDKPWVNTRSGFVDLVTGELHPHDPELLSFIQFPITYDPTATCPKFDAWVKEIGIEDQILDLEETVSTMLDPTGTPTRAVLLYGPSRSGKSTYLRLLKALAGAENVSGVTLHQLSDDRFAAANVYGKVLNIAADLSAKHVEDISIFKLMTGEDLIQANRKFGQEFPFTNRALFAFSANEIPTVGESSRAYSERMKPFKFGVSFASRQDPQQEVELYAELPGIFNRLVRAWQARKARGSFLETVPEIRHEFETMSDRVRQWLDEDMEVIREVDGVAVSRGSSWPVAVSTTPTELSRLFNRWAEANNTSTMGRNKVTQRLTSYDGVVEVRQVPTKARALNIVARRTSGSGGSSGLPPDNRKAVPEVDDKVYRGSSKNSATPATETSTLLDVAARRAGQGGVSD